LGADGMVGQMATSGTRPMRILVIEDENRIASFIEKGLRAEGYQTMLASDGVTGLHRATTDEFALVILDYDLRGIDAFDLLKRLRSSDSRLPIIALATRNVGGDVVRRPEGADDYVPKPFQFATLAARVRLQLRSRVESGEVTILQRGQIRLDLRTREAAVADRSEELTNREFSLAEMFLRNPGEVLSREQLLSHVWGYDHDPGTNVLDVYVGYLRRKLGSDVIKTVRGTGYQFDPAGT
jgi:DNA-binding response OmpR family regulator